MDGALMPILHALQAEFGYIDQAIEPILLAGRIHRFCDAIGVKDHAVAAL